MQTNRAENRWHLASWRFALSLVLTGLLSITIIVLGRNPQFGPLMLLDLKILLPAALALAFGAYVVVALLQPLVIRLPAGQGIVFYFLLIGGAMAGAELHGYLAFLMHSAPTYRPSWQNIFTFKVAFYAALVAGPLLRYTLLREKIRQGEKTQKESKAQALHSRIRPHFLFNSLNSIATLAHNDPDRAEAILHNLADLFRVLLADARNLVPITAEKEIARQYLEIEKIRLGDRLNVEWSINKVPQTTQIPALTLQPLLENAIYHGIEPRFAGGTITIRLWTDNDETLGIMISNPLPDVPQKLHTKGNKIAQDNIRQRLETHFGRKVNMQSLQEGNDYHIKIRIPLKLGR